MTKVYLMGSLRNENIPVIANEIRALGPYDVFDDWFAAGPEADDRWRDYEKGRGHDLVDALDGHSCNHVFSFDKEHIDSSDICILLLPAGRSGHLELGYAVGKGKHTIICLDGEPERFDVMYRFASRLCRDREALLKYLRGGGA